MPTARIKPNTRLTFDSETYFEAGKTVTLTDEQTKIALQMGAIDPNSIKPDPHVTSNTSAEALGDDSSSSTVSEVQTNTEEVKTSQDENTSVSEAPEQE